MSDAPLPIMDQVSNFFQKQGEAILVIGVVLVVGLLVLPLPPFLLDGALALSIALSLLVLLVALNSTRALDFSAFPSVLLLLTLYRLALNVSSTRLILGEGEAGKVIEAFGSFVIGGNYVVGVVIFLILIAINFIVITKGAGRVAEVAARFTLDAMPGRQMSIDGDLSAGLIDDVEAKRRREEISQEADFYGAMDGSAKFVRGDAIAGLLITAINILGGLYVGVVQRGMPVTTALAEYTVLTVGDGLVSQIPALILSTAAGIMVTSASGGHKVAGAVMMQLGRKASPLWMASGFLGLLAVVPGLPTIPFLALAMASGGAARFVANREIPLLAGLGAGGVGTLSSNEGGRQVSNVPAERSPVQELLQVDPLELELGYALIPLVDGSQGGDLLDRIRLLRKQAATDLGFLVPPIRIRDDVRLSPSEYTLRVRGTEVARAELLPRHLLALDTGSVLAPVEGIETRDPSFGMAARWIEPEGRIKAEAAGWVVVDPSTVLATHLLETLKRHAADLLGRQDVQEMVQTLRESHPALVDEVIPNRVPPGTLHRVLQRLLKERIPIRDLVTILETLADAPDSNRDPEVLTEHVRRALSHVIGELFQDETGEVRAITLGPKLEAQLMSLFSPRAGRTAAGLMDPDVLANLLGDLDRLHRAHAADRPLPLIVPPGLRVGVRRLIEPVMPAVPVISLAELPARVGLRTVALWEMKNA